MEPDDPAADRRAGPVGRGLHDDSGGVPSGYLARFTHPIDEVHLTEVEGGRSYLDDRLGLRGGRLVDVSQA